jgi:hypothetical protein
VEKPTHEVPPAQVLLELFPAHQACTGDGAAQVPVGGTTVQSFWADAAEMPSSIKSKSEAPPQRCSVLSSLGRRISIRAVVPLLEPGGVQFARAGPLLNSDGPDNLARSSQKKTGIRGQDHQAQLSTIVVAARVVREVGSNERKVSSSPQYVLFWGLRMPGFTDCRHHHTGRGPKRWGLATPRSSLWT